MSVNISVLTITQYSRRYTFELLVDMVKYQTLKPSQWVIVDGSKSQHEGNLNSVLILKTKENNPDLNIHYIPYKKRTFSDMLNTGNNECFGDFIIQMEDDDYYPPTRIEHAVSCLLEDPYIEIVGCSSVYCYDYTKNMLFKSPFFNDYHSSNHALAYRRSYLKNNFYYTVEESKPFMIETSFLKNYCNKMIQLDPRYTIVNSVHKNNTINRTSIFESWIRIPVSLSEIPHFNEFYREKFKKIFDSF